MKSTIESRIPWITYLIFSIVWYFGIMAGCAYCVFILGASGWWFLLAVICMDSFKPADWIPEMADKRLAEYQAGMHQKSIDNGD